MCYCKPALSTARLDAVMPIEVDYRDDAVSPVFGIMAYKNKFTVHLDAMHLMMCMGCQLPGNHPCMPRFLQDLGNAIC